MRYYALSQPDTSGLEADHLFATPVEQSHFKKTSFVTRHLTKELAQEVLLPAHFKILRHITTHMARKLQRSLHGQRNSREVLSYTLRATNNASYHT
jgi:hypothetical protein